MHSATHRLNHDFQLRYFVAGSCYTPDGAYCIMYAQKIDIESKLKSAEAQLLDQKIKRVRAERLLASTDIVDNMEGQKMLLELEAVQYIWDMNLEGAKRELATIESIMADIEPMRQYSHLSILDANEACQQNEWLYELRARAENHMLSTGTIPPAELETMRMHPDFQTRILPHITTIRELVNQNRIPELMQLIDSNKLKLPVLTAAGAPALADNIVT